MRIYRLIVFIFGIFIYLNTQAQNYTQTIRGTVKDKESQFLLANVAVTITSLASSSIIETDANGNFRLDNIPIGRHTLRFAKDGYKEAIIPDIIVSSAKEAVINVELEEEVSRLKEVKIKASPNASKTNNEMITVSGRLFTTDQTNRFAGSLADPSRMAANFAGVSGVGGQRNDIVIRGNSPMGLLWRLEGVDIPSPNHFSSQGSTGGPVSILNNNTLANSDFITGAFPAGYGNCLSGVFDLKLRNGNNEKREYTGQIGFNGFEFGAEGPINRSKKSSYLINYRYSTLGVFDALGIDLTFAGIPKYQDVTMKLNFPETKTGQWQFTAIGGISSIAILDANRDTGDLSFGNGRNNIYNGTDMGLAILSNQYRIDKKSYIKTMVSATYQKRFTQVDSLNAANDAYLVYAEKTKNIKGVLHSFYHNKINKKNNIRVGMILTKMYTHLQDSFLNNDGKLQTLRKFDGGNYLTQFYIEHKCNINSKLTLNTGLHYLYWAMNKTESVEPRTGLRWAIKSGKTLTAGYGLHSQLQPLEIYYSQVVNNKGQYVKNNTTLDLSRAHHFVLGYEQLFGKSIRLKVEVYCQNLYNIPVDTDRISTFSILNFGSDFNSLPVRNKLVNKGTGRNKGIEVTFEKYFNKGYYWLLTGSFFDSRYKSLSGKEYNTAFNGKYVVNGLFGYEWKMGKNRNNILSINLKSTIAGGRRKTPTNIDSSKYYNEQRFDYNRSYADQYQPYTRTDIRIGFKLNGKKVTQEWAIDIQNVLNQLNPLTDIYDPNEKKVITQYQQKFFPIALYRIQF
ncbi:MAG: TonB-dependent receptor [Bacteroidota bacterium]|nr:TonB-dependent receptor [Bacteroidota bacterium]